MTKACYYCSSTTEEMRPYGPSHSFVCYGCAMMTPERVQETTRNFLAQLDAAGPNAVIGEETGPRPLDSKGSTND